MTTINNVLVASDLSDEAERALRHASSLAARFGARLAVYHAVPVPDHGYAHWAFSRNAQVWCELEREARLSLQRSAEKVRRDVSITVERAASVPRAVLDFVRSTRPDLVVMATHGRRGVEHLLLGSVTETVFRQAHRPVLCVRGTEHESALPYRRILVTTDFSPVSQAAFPMAAHLARSAGAEVLAVHVARTPSTAMSATPGPLVPTEGYVWKFCQREFQDVALTAQVHFGTAWDRIVQAARVEHADLIVMATRGHDSLRDRVVGSNADRVVRHAPCPVLVV